MGLEINDDAGAENRLLLDSGPLQLREALHQLVESGHRYSAEYAQEAAAGEFWRMGGFPPKFSAGENIRQAAVLVLFWNEPETGAVHVLLTERSAHLAKHPGQISFPGGAVEEFDDDVAATALREAQEEVGLDPARVEVLGALPPAPVPISGFNVTPVIAVTEDPGVLAPQVGEVEHVLKVALADLVEPENRYTAVVKFRGNRMLSPAFWLTPGTGGVFVWGFTAMLLDRITRRLGVARSWDTSREVDPHTFGRGDR